MNPFDESLLNQEIPPAELQKMLVRDRNRFMRDSLATVCNVLVIVFAVVITCDSLLYFHSQPLPLILMGLVSILSFVGISRFTTRKTLPSGYANPVAVSIVACVLANLLVREYLFSSQLNMTILAMFTMSLGVYFLSTRWLMVSLQSTTLLSTFVIGQIDASRIPDFLQLQLAAVGFSLITHAFRSRTFRRISELRIHLEKRAEKLKQAVSASQENENKFRRISESVPFGIFQVNPDGYCEYSNNQYRRICISSGLTKIEHRWIEILPAEIQAETFQKWQDATNDFTSFNGVYLIQATNGDSRWLEVLLSPVFSDDGAVFVGIIEDITEKKLANDKLQQNATDLQISKGQLELNSKRLEVVVAELEVAKTKAEQSARSKSEFLANMSHEIRTPMTAILGYTDILLEEIHYEGEFAGHLQTIKRNGLHLLEIINDILDISKIEAGKMDVEIIPTSTQQIIQDVYELMSIRARDKKIELLYDFQTPIPQQIQTDPTRLRQILLNLVSNAIKFTEQGIVHIFARLIPQLAQETSPHLELSVKDSGIGMTADQMSRLFQPFSQADSSMSRRFGGTGLGLTISQRLAQKLGGKISVESKSGSGSIFTVSIPTGETNSQALIPATMTESPSFQSQQVIAATQQSQKPIAAGSNSQELNCRILLAEDGLDNQKLISFLLRKAGAEVTLAENGQIAVEKVAQSLTENRPYDVILMDMQMPIMDGYTAASTLRQQGNTLPIIALTAHAMSGDREKCLAAGCSEFATKPINRPQLIQVINQQLEATRVQPSVVDC